MSDIAVSTMTAEEARACVDGIKSHYNNMRRLIYELYSREDWRSLGYESFHACLEGEFSQSVQHLYRLKRAEEIEIELNEDSPMGETVNLPERHARVLSTLPNPESRQTAYASAVTLAKAEGEQRVKLAHVEKAVAIERVRQQVTESPYHVVSHMMASGDITPATALAMVKRLEATAPKFQAYLMELIAKYSITCPDLLPELVEMKNRPPGRESLTLANIEATGQVAGVPLSKATLTDLQRARWEAKQEHIAESDEKGIIKPVPVVPVIITVYKGNPERTLKALSSALSDGDLIALADLIVKAQTAETQSESA